MKNDIILRHTEEMLQYFDGGDYTAARRETEFLREAVLDLLRDSEAKKGGVSDIVRLFKMIAKKPKNKVESECLYKLYKHNSGTFVATGYQVAYYTDELPVDYNEEGYEKFPSIFFEILAESQYKFEPVEIPDIANLQSEIERYKIQKKAAKLAKHEIPKFATHIFDNEKILNDINTEWLLQAIKAGISELRYIPKRQMFYGKSADGKLTWVCMGVRK